MKNVKIREISILGHLLGFIPLDRWLNPLSWKILHFSCIGIDNTYILVEKFDIKKWILRKYLIFLTGFLLLEGSSEMGLWDTTLHKDTIFFKLFF